MVELNEVLISDIHAAALTGDLPDGVYPVSVSVRLDRATTDDRTDKDLRPPEFPAPVKHPVGTAPYIPQTTVWLENPALVDNRGDKVWDHDEFSEKMDEEIERIRNKGHGARDRFYLTRARFVEVLDKSYLKEGEDGRLRPSPEFYEDHGEMSIAYFDKRPTITNDEVREKLKREGVISGQIKQPLRLTKYKRVRAKEHNPSVSTRRYFTGGQAENLPGVEASDVRPRVYKHPDEITDHDDSRHDVVVQRLQVGLDEIGSHFPTLAASDLWVNVTFIGEYNTTDEFVEDDVVIQGSAPVA